jgi:hypothetical protein
MSNFVHTYTKKKQKERKVKHGGSVHKLHKCFEVVRGFSE